MAWMYFISNLSHKPSIQPQQDLGRSSAHELRMATVDIRSDWLDRSSRKENSNFSGESMSVFNGSNFTLESCVGSILEGIFLDYFRTTLVNHG